MSPYFLRKRPSLIKSTKPKNTARPPGTVFAQGGTNEHPYRLRLPHHIGIYASMPLFRRHARALGRHRGHADPPSLFDTLLGFFILWVFLRVVWALAYPDAG
jgi:hypothetical protein